MKKILCIVLVGVLSLFLLTGCTKTISTEERDAFLSYLTGDSKESYLLTGNGELDLTGVNVSSDKIVFLQKGVTLKVTGSYLPGSGVITFQAEKDDAAKDATVDFSGLQYVSGNEKADRLFEIRYDVKLINPAEQDFIVVDTSNEEWTSVRQKQKPKEQPPEEPIEVGPTFENSVATADEFLEALNTEGLDQINLVDNITVQFDKTTLTREFFVTCNNFTLTLTGELNMQGGKLEIGDSPGNEESKVDVSGLTVTCDRSVYAEDFGDLIFIGMGFRRIIGEPTIPEDLIYEIPDDGKQASVEMREVTTPKQHEAKLQEEMTAYLSGNEEDYPGGVSVRSKFLADGVLEIYLDNPTIDHYIGLQMDPGTKIIITGSVTFDGGTYALGVWDDTDGTEKAVVDITGLQINGTKELGHEKTPDLFSVSGDMIDFKFNEKAPNIITVQNDRFWLRWDDK